MFVSRDEEWITIQRVSKDLEKYSITPVNGLIINVSPDYSSTISLHLAHHLSADGEMMTIIPVDVPYPDEDAGPYRNEFIKKLPLFNKPKLVLVEAGIITGGNYTFMKEVLENIPGKEVITVAQYENIHSKFKCDVVGRYYNWEQEQLEFYWERENKHWK